MRVRRVTRAELLQLMGIDPIQADKHAEAHSHAADCRCDLCLSYWSDLGPERGQGAEGYGPFQEAEIAWYRAHGRLPTDAERRSDEYVVRRVAGSLLDIPIDPRD